MVIWRPCEIEVIDRRLWRKKISECEYDLFSIKNVARVQDNLSFAIVERNIYRFVIVNIKVNVFFTNLICRAEAFPKILAK